jgi:hypothetical protein
MKKQAQNEEIKRMEQDLAKRKQVEKQRME